MRAALALPLIVAACSGAAPPDDHCMPLYRMEGAAAEPCDDWATRAKSPVPPKPAELERVEREVQSIANQRAPRP
jgi:hypothetical protein